MDKRIEKIQKLQEILNAEANFCMDVRFNEDMSLSLFGVQENEKEDEIEDEINDIRERVQEIASDLPDSLIVQVSYPEREITRGKTFGGDDGEWEEMSFLISVYHKHPSSLGDRYYHQVLNTTIKMTFQIKRNLKNEGWVVDGCSHEPEILMNQAFSKTCFQSECNAIYLLKYDDLEFVIDENDYQFPIHRLRQYEGDVDVFNVERHLLDNIQVEEDMDCVTTDCAMRFYIKKTNKRV